MNEFYYPVKWSKMPRSFSKWVFNNSYFCQNPIFMKFSHVTFLISFLFFLTSGNAQNHYHTYTAPAPTKQTYQVNGTKYVSGETYKTTGKPMVDRSEAAKREFLKSKGYSEVPKGYQVDHIVPLSQGGADKPSNMQLLTIQQHAEKTARERQQLSESNKTMSNNYSYSSSNYKTPSYSHTATKTSNTYKTPNYNYTTPKTPNTYKEPSYNYSTPKATTYKTRSYNYSAPKPSTTYKEPSYNYSTPKVSNTYKEPSYNYSAPKSTTYKEPSYNYSTPKVPTYKEPSYNYSLPKSYNTYKAPSYNYSTPKSSYSSGSYFGGSGGRGKH